MTQPTPTKNELADLMSYLTPQEIAEIDRLLASSEPRLEFSDFLHRVTPRWNWTWDHLVLIREHLDRVTSGEIKRLMLFMPPRHGKSEMTTIRYPVYRMTQDAEFRVILGAYNQTLANKFSRKARKIAEEQIDVNLQSKSMADWETVQGGGMRAAGVGAGVTGMGADLIVIDDPIKNREEANSEVYREKVWNWYTDDLYTRLEPGGSIILIMTRWHEDDLAGRLLEANNDRENEFADDWVVVNLPAEAEADDLLGREIGEALCPDRYNLDALYRIRNVLGNSYHALYQQSPQPAEGGMFKRDGFTRTVEVAPTDCDYVRYWDKAGTSGGGAYTAGVLMARRYDGGGYYIIDVSRGQWGIAEREAEILRTAHADEDTYGHVQVWIEQEPGSAGKESAQSTIRNLSGFSVWAEPATGSKEVRAEPFAAQAGAGNVILIRGSWNRDYVDELCSFPSGKYKDQVDASSGAFSKLADSGSLILFGV